MPPKETTIGVLSSAVSKIEAYQMPASISGTFKSTLEFLAPEMGLVYRILIGNLWLFSPLMARALSNQPATNALIRTTTAPTIISAGNKDNVLPKTATATVNFRIVPGETVTDIIAHLKYVINDERVQVLPIPGGLAKNASPISKIDTPGWKYITKAIAQVLPEALAVPYLTVGATDARYFYPFSDSVYRYIPYTLTKPDLARIHGLNERVAIKDYQTSISFFYNLIKNSQQDLSQAPRHHDHDL